jgi:SAM-dependent methyltransferase
MAFVEITGPEYTEVLRKRLLGEVPKLTWLQQFFTMLKPHVRPGVNLLDVGCGSGYAYDSFKELGVIYTGLDWEPEYLKIAREHFAGCPEVSFLQHDIVAAPPQKTAHLVICSATLEHCPTLMPALQHLVDATEEILLLRTFLGQVEHIHSIPSPVPEFREIHKHTNQYAFKDVLGYIESRSFRTRVYRDEYTDSMPQYVDRAMRTFYVVKAEKIEPGTQHKPHAGWPSLGPGLND